ncbi:IQ domain-containing protein IQM6-like [Durio zibethinus]|uniref:IQ domain-containing protein IQM6-like n=1 Tax=Durio zibethinus TaxID=66656 RepID=A0A6P6APX7_DURZI|nr:IQ domain-containing protein IQM6-like [Durio zibethinus]
MGVTFSCPLSDLDDLERRFEAVIVKSISFKDGDEKKVLRSVSFNGRVSEPKGMEPYDTRKKKSLSFNKRETGTIPSYRTPSMDKENKVSVRPESCKNVNNNNILQRSINMSEKKSRSDFAKLGGRRYQAALKLQKVYKSFRTRRRLADCAVIAEQRWWKLLDFVELKRSSISFFEIEKPETAISRWSRARTRAAKVGKGLSKDEKARKLALQHWLEAIDPRHRYGHNLQFYYAKWLHCDSKQPFFYWLDIGEGKEVNLEKCPRAKLQQQCIKYLGPTERENFEVVVRNGKFFYKQSGELLDTTGERTDAKWIFVLSASKTLYVGQKNKGNFQHSSFLAGGATLSAGRLVVEDGVLKAVWPHSGHYLPTEENFQEFMSFLREHYVDLTNVKKSSSEEEEPISRKNSIFRSNEPEAEGLQQTEATNSENSAQENTGSRKEDSDAAQNANKSMSRLSRGLFSKISRLQIPARQDVFDIFKTETLPPSCRRERPESPEEDGYETAEEFLSEEDFLFTKVNLFGEDDDEEDHKPIPKEKIMRRIDSHKGLKSYQLAQQLSSKWSTGAGPRISCMRDYPSELQFRVLEQANLTPRARSASASPLTTSRFSPIVLTPTSLRKETSSSKSPLGPKASDRKEKSKSLVDF